MKFERDFQVLHFFSLSYWVSVSTGLTGSKAFVGQLYQATYYGDQLICAKFSLNIPVLRKTRSGLILENKDVYVITKKKGKKVWQKGTIMNLPL